MKNIIFIYFCLVTSIIYSQNELNKEILYQRSFTELESDFWDTYPDFRAEVYADIYFKKAKNKNDSLLIAKGFDFKARLYEPEINIAYADSIIAYTKNLKHQDFPAVGYSLKAYWNYQTGHYKIALDNYIIAYDLAKNHNNVTQIIENGEGITALKNRWGQHDEALNLYKSQLNLIQQQKHYKKEFKEHYFNTLYNLNVSYKRNQDYDSSAYYIRKGIEESLNLHDTSFYYDFVYSSGINHFYLEKYKAAIDSLNKSEPFLDSSELAISYYYKGLISKKTGKVEKATSYFLQMDSIYSSSGDIFPEITNAYNFLIDYYKDREALEKQIVFMDKLILADSLINSNNYYMNIKVLQDYDIPQLKNEKIALSNQIKNKNDSIYYLILISIITLAITVYVAIRQYLRKRKIHKRLQELIYKKQKDASILASKEDLNIDNKNELKGISENIIVDILNKLKKFENNLGFLNKDLKLNDLADEFSTNSLYLSKIVNAKKQKNFSNYLKDLRIEYAIELLKKNIHIRKYTIAAIAQEVGFKSAESFSKSFYKKTSIYPSVFIQKLEESGRNL